MRNLVGQHQRDHQIPVAGFRRPRNRHQQPPPDQEQGPVIETQFSYGESVSPLRPGLWRSNGDQIVITNRIVKRVIAHAMDSHGYDPCTRSPVVTIKWIEDFIQMDDVVCATDPDQS